MSLSSMESPLDDDCRNSSNKTQASDNLSIFCREVRNLLRSKPNCMIPFSKFVPAYHNHYGRQCCVYQFGYTKLIELLESIPHVVQIIGDGTTNNRYITLTHREQIKRFASDLIKVVKSQPGKKLKLSQFAHAYEQVLEIWEGTINIIPINRSRCEAHITEPLFVTKMAKSNNKINKNQSMESQSPTETPTNIISNNMSPVINQLVASHDLTNLKPYITESHPDAWFEIPKRERSEKEIKRTKYFIWDVIELLSKMAPEYSVPFSKFIPSYHYYFNRQCKVSIFGFSKLIDLFESISPEVVKIIDQGPGEEKIIKLAEKHIPSKTQHKIHNRRPQESHKCAPKTHHKSHSHSHNIAISSSESGGGTGSGNTSNSSSSNGLSDYNQKQSIAIDSGPTEEELLELEEELEAYELQCLQSKRSARMAAVLCT